MQERKASAKDLRKPCYRPDTRGLVTYCLLVVCFLLLGVYAINLVVVEMPAPNTRGRLELANRPDLRQGKSGLELGPQTRFSPDQRLEAVTARFPRSCAVVRVDFSRFRHRNIRGPRLPVHVMILNAGPASWEHYGRYDVLVIIFIALETLFIIVLLLRRARQQQTDHELQEGEAGFRLMTDTPALVWMCDKDGKVTYLDSRPVDITGPYLFGELGDVWSAFVHPEDLQTVVNANAVAFREKSAFSKEYRLHRRDGVYRWMLDIAAPRFREDGSFAGFVGSAIDITEYKLTHEALETIGGRLIAAQERERSRIARELHDDICQRLALLSLELEQVNRESNGSTGPEGKIDEIRRHCAEIADDLQAVSHELHSSRLDYLGITAAVRNFCHEFSRQHDVTIEFIDENVPRALPKDISLSLFRVTQEALHNALKHSGVRQFSVILRGTGNEIHLEVRDRGRGFVVEAAKQDRGLGLVSMQERVHLVHGRFSIESKANGGTRVLARVPWVVGTNTDGAQETES
jgi:PAS domain S-box-containing protein